MVQKAQEYAGQMKQIKELSALRGYFGPPMSLKNVFLLVY